MDGRVEEPGTDSDLAHRRGPSRASNNTNATASTTFSRISQSRGFRRISRALSLVSSRRPPINHAVQENGLRGRSSSGRIGTAQSANVEANIGRPTSAKPHYVHIRVQGEPTPSVPPVPPTIPIRTTSARTGWPTTEKEYVERVAGSYQFETVPTLVRTPWEFERARRPASSATVKRRPFPRYTFELLPLEIYDCILDGLRATYTTQHTTDVQSLYRDFLNLMLVSRKWHRTARDQMYRELWLPSSLEQGDHSKRTFGFHRPRSRLRLLLGVLMTYPGLASLVERIHVSDKLLAELPIEPFFEPKNEVRNREGCVALQAVTAIVLRCPNLMQFTGYIPPGFVPDVAGLLRALSTRRFLTAHAWSLTTLTVDMDGNIVTGLGDFIDCHRNWDHLETLVLSNSMPNFELGPMTIPMVLDQLPALKNLLVRGFSAGDFSDDTLWALPPTLINLRLESLAGVTNEGLEQMSYEEISKSLKKLSLVKMGITSMWTIQTILRRLQCLQRFTFVQDNAPKYFRSPARRNGPRLRSDTLEELHWNIFFPAESTHNLADSIGSGLFPRLRHVKVPSDYEGTIQTLCRPIERRNLEMSDMELLGRFEKGENVHYECFLRLAQIYAQLRVRDREKQPNFNFVISDDDEGTKQTHVIGKYVGNMESRIEYDLSPDLPGSPYALVRLDDFQEPPLLLDAKDGEERKMDLRLLF